MEVGKLCTANTICCARDETIQGAALLMRRHHVGDIVVHEPDGERTPVGIVTDRDDDLLAFLAEEMEDLSRISPYQQAHERRARH